MTISAEVNRVETANGTRRVLFVGRPGGGTELTRWVALRQWFVSASPSTVSRAPVTAPVGTAPSRARSSAAVRVMSAAATFSSR